MGVALDGPDFRAARLQEICVEGTSKATTWRELAQELPELWIVVARAFARCVPSERAWGTILISIDPELGRVRAALRDFKDSARVSPLVVDVLVGMMKAEALALPDPYRDDAAYASGLARLRGLCLESLEVGVEDPHVRAALRELLLPHSLSIQIDVGGRERIRAVRVLP